MPSTLCPKNFSLARRVLLTSLIWYQRLLSFDHGLLGKIVPLRVCRFTPTCSTYAFLAIWQWGVRRGCWLALKRLLRCHPWAQGGYNPPPAPKPMPASGQRRRCA